MKNFFVFFILICIFITIILSISPFFDFPLNDDWVYVNAVKEFIGHCKLSKDPFITPTLTLQIFLGSLFSKLFGLSFTALRFLTIILSLVCIITLYFILKELGFGETKCILGSLVLLLNPIYIHLTYTFMTDVPYLAFFFLAILSFLKALKQDSLVLLIIGEIAIILSSMIKQNGIFLFIAVAVYFIFMVIKKKKYQILKGSKIWIIFSLSFLYILIYFFWRFSDIYKVTPLVDKFTDRNFKDSLSYLFIIFSYLAFFLFPLLSGYVCNLKLLKNNKIYRNLLIMILIFSVFVTFIRAKNNFLMPYLRSIISSTGVGSTINLQGFRDTLFPQWCFVFFTYFSTSFAGVLVSLIFSTIRNKQIKKNDLFNLIYLIGIMDFFSILMLTPEAIYDRYLLPLILPGIVLIFNFYENEKLSKVIVFIFLIFMGIFSIKGTKDCISWNNARWQAGEFLLSRKIPIDQIDGGYEWNGWHFYNQSTDTAENLWQLKNYNYASVIQPKNRKYIISFKPKKEYKVFKKLSYRAYLGKKEQFIYILEKLK